MDSLTLIFISDTHTYHDQIDMPEGDIVFHTGDATYRGLKHEVESFGRWFRQLPHKYKVFVAGNHDKSFEFNSKEAREWLGFDKNFRDNKGKCFYLEDELIEIEGLKIYGTPWQPTFGYGWAFNADRGESIREKWNMVEPCDILLTHGPAKDLLDWAYMSSENVGCDDLLRRILEIKPLIHAAGHIHEAYGTAEPSYVKTLFINASICTLQYKPTNSPIVVRIVRKEDKWTVDDYWYHNSKDL